MDIKKLVAALKDDWASYFLVAMFLAFLVLSAVALFQYVTSYRFLHDAAYNMRLVAAVVSICAIGAAGSALIYGSVNVLYRAVHRFKGAGLLKEHPSIAGVLAILCFYLVGMMAFGWVRNVFPI